MLGSGNIPETYIDENNDEQIVEPLEPEATFDYLSVHAVIVTPNIKHDAYGLPYSEYRKRRARSTDRDADEKNSNVGFYTDEVLGMLLRSLAARRDISLYAYITDMLEEGQIHFHPEYHEQYEEVNDILNSMNAKMNNDAQARAVSKLRNLKIKFGVCARGNPYFVPRVPYWLAEDIKTVSMDLHMSVSDVAYIYVITGILSTDAVEIPITQYQDKTLSHVLTVFRSELDSMLDVSKHIYSGFDNLI